MILPVVSELQTTDCVDVFIISTRPVEVKCGTAFLETENYFSRFGNKLFILLLFLNRFCC